MVLNSDCRTFHSTRFIIQSLILSLGSLACGNSCGEEDLSRPIAKKINSDDDLILGPYAESRTGDFVLDNGLVRFAFQRPGSATGWGVFGGSLVDVDSKLEDSASFTNQDLFQELFPHCNLRAFKAKEATITSVGSESEPGILTIRGTDGGFPLFDSLLPSEPLDIEVTLEVKLAPGARQLELLHRVKDRKLEETRDLFCGLIVVAGDQNFPFVPNTTKDVSEISSPISEIFFTSNKNSGIFIRREEGTFDLIAPTREVVVLNAEKRPFLVNDSREERYLIGVGAAGDVESVKTILRSSRSDTSTLRTVRLNLDTNLPFERFGKFVTAKLERIDETKAEATPVTVTKFDTNSTASVQLADGSYQLDLTLGDLKISGERLEVSGDVSQKVQVTGFGVLELESSAEFLEKGTLSSPVRISLIQGHDADLNAPIAVRKYVQARDTVLAPVGDYTMVASRGPEFELQTQNVTVSEGSASSYQIKVVQSVDSSGWVSGDYHVHGARSMDSTASRKLRVIAAIAEGLDILVATDHDVTTDYGPIAEELGLQDLLHTIPGIEISPLYGHMNAYPMPVDEKEPYWSLKWWEYDANEKFAGVHDPATLVDEARLNGAQVVAANHPRDNQAVFDYLNLMQNGSVRARWPGFDAFELMNDTNTDDIPKLMNDWLALISADRRITAIGVSDSHGEFGLGYSRTYTAAAIDEPSRIDETELWGSMKNGKAIATTGPFVRFSARSGDDVVSIGEEIKTSTTVTFEFEVHGPSWMQIANVELLENGTTLEFFPVPDSSDGGFREKYSVKVSPSKDSVYILRVNGKPGARHPFVINAEARAVTNPIYVDFGADGFSYEL